MSALPVLRHLLAPNPSPMTLDGTRTYLVGRSRPVVIDPGPEDARHLAALRGALGDVRPAAILLTHGHSDHAAAGPSLAHSTGAPLMMARGAMSSVVDAGAVDRWIGEGEEIETDAGVVRAIATPGHAPEHLAFFWQGEESPEGGALFVGDLLMGEGDTTLVAPPEGDLRLYLDSLRRIRELGPGILYPTHGPPLTHPDAALGRYLAHRRERLEQVYHALARSGPANPGELVGPVYGAELDPRLRAAAEGSVRAILRYLEAEGQVERREDDRYSAAAGSRLRAEEGESLQMNPEPKSS